jgi:hypothetical protein
LLSGGVGHWRGRWLAVVDVKRGGVACGRIGFGCGRLVLFASTAFVVSCHAPQQSLGKERIKAMEKLGSGKMRVKPAKAMEPD